MVVCFRLVHGYGQVTCWVVISFIRQKSHSWLCASDLCMAMVRLRVGLVTSFIRQKSHSRLCASDLCMAMVRLRVGW